MGEALTQALHQTVADPSVWVVVIGAAIYGVFVGAVPGLTATMAVALFIPIAYWLDPVPALGQHTDAILRELGYADEQVARWRAERAV